MNKKANERNNINWREAEVLSQKNAKSAGIRREREEKKFGLSPCGFSVMHFQIFFPVPLSALDDGKIESSGI